MKNMAKRITALVMTILLAFPTGIGLSEEQAMSISDAVVTSSDEVSDDAAAASSNASNVADAESDDSEDEVFSDAVDLEVGEADDAELGGEDEREPDNVGAVTIYWFLVNDELYDEQSMGDGEAIQCPEDPEVPGGMAFSGWFLEDGTQLFAEGEEIAHVDEEHPFVNVIARFEDASTQDLSSDEEAVPGDSPVDVENDDASTDVEDNHAPVDTDTIGETTANTTEDDEENAGDGATTQDEENATPSENAASDEDETPAPDAEKGEDGVGNTPETDDTNTPEEDQDADSDQTESDETFDDEQSDESETSGEAQDESDETSDGEQCDEGETSEVLPFRVTFSTEPEDAVVTVFAAHNNDEDAEQGEAEEDTCQDESKAVEAQENGSWLLFPGDYTYSASAEGYKPIESVSFTVTDEALTINVEMVVEEAEEAQPVSVVFNATPKEAFVTVYPAAAEGEAETIAAQEDGSYALLPGEYVYNAEAEGYIALENVPFTVADEPLEIAIELEAEEQPMEEAEEAVPFDQSMTVNGVTVTVQAEAGVFPADAVLSVARVPVMKRREADAAVEEVRDEDQNVAVSYTFDIKVVNPATREDYQPAEGAQVNVTFSLEEASDDNLTASVYHITEEDGDLTAEKLEAGVLEDAVMATTDGFSLYTVEFTYNKLQFVLQGNESEALATIMEAVGLSGEVTAVEISNTDLFSASDETGAWVIKANKPFNTEEWMKVTINERVYEINVTDALSYVDVDGNTKTLNDFNVINSTTTNWGHSYSTTYYAVTGTDPITIGRRVTVLGTVVLILCDGATLKCEKGISVTQTAAYNELAVYGQTANSGTLYAGTTNGSNTTCESWRAGIGGDGTMANGEYYSCAGVVSIYGGKVYAFGGYNSAGIGGGFYSNTVDGHTTSEGGRGANITIHGGTVIAQSGEKGSAMERPPEAIGRGATSSAIPPDSGELDFYGRGYGIKVANASGKYVDYAARKDTCRGTKATTAMCTGHHDNPCTLCEYYIPIYYINCDSKGFPNNNHSVLEKDYWEITQNTDLWDSTAVGNVGRTGWYVLRNSVTITQPITVRGGVCLILCDGCTLTASDGIVVETGSSLSVYAGNTLNSISNTGKLVVNCSGSGHNHAGIGSSGTQKEDADLLKLNGGIIEAHGSGGGAGIGSGTGESPGGIIIQGCADVKAYGGNGGGAGIGGGYNDRSGFTNYIVIGGKAKVEAHGGGSSNGGAGVGSGGAGEGESRLSSDIRIKGEAVVKAYGSGGGAGIGGGYNSRISNPNSSVSERSTNSVNIHDSATVEAYGSGGGAGIGRGQNGGFRIINIDSNSVGITAVGGESGKALCNDEGYAINVANGLEVKSGANAGHLSAALYKDNGRIVALQDNHYATIETCAHGQTFDHETGKCTHCNGDITTRLSIETKSKPENCATFAITVQNQTAQYALSGEQITLKITPSENYDLGALSYIYTFAGANSNPPVSIDNVSKNADGSYTASFTMPGGSIIITATMLKHYYYSDVASGSSATSKQCEQIAQSDTEWKENGASGGWYVVSDDITFDTESRVNITGVVNLILCDGKKLIAPAGITVNYGNTLNVYAGNSNTTINGTGALIAGKASDAEDAGVNCIDQCAGIGGNKGNSGSVVVNGGTVKAAGGSGSAGIGGGYRGNSGSIVINGGTVMATGGSNGAGIGGGYSGNGTVSIYSGMVNAIGGSDAAGLGSGKDAQDSSTTISLDWTPGANNAIPELPSITASSYAGKLQMLKDFKDGDGVVYSAIAEAPVSALNAMAGKTLKPAKSEWRELQATINNAGSEAIFVSKFDYPDSKGTKDGKIIAGPNDSALSIPSNKKVTLNLDGMTIDRHLTSAVTNGNVITVSGTLNLTDGKGGGTITGGNNSGDGGGVVVSGGTFNMTNGKITGNNAATGGGVVVGSGIFNMTGGEISGNIAPTGGGVYYSDGTFKMSGTPVITGNKAGSGEDAPANNVHLNNGKTITITFPLAESVNELTTKANIGISMQAPGAFTTGYGYGEGGYNAGKFLPDEGYFTPDSSDFTVGLTTVEGRAEAALLNPWQALQGRVDYQPVDDPSDEDKLVTIPLENSITATADDGALNVPVGRNVRIDLNGKTIDRGLKNEQPVKDGNVIDVKGTLTVTGSGTITGGKNSDDGGGVIVDGGTFNLTGGTIKGNAANCGGGVFVTNSGEFNMYVETGKEAPVITGNTADVNGGGVYVAENGTFTLSGGIVGSTDTSAVNGNHANDAGGGVTAAGTFAMEGGSIAGNTAGCGGGGLFVYGDDNVHGFADMSGGEITGNSSVFGGGAYVDGNAELVMREDAGIADNTSSRNGGGVYVYDEGALVMRDGSTITDNTIIESDSASIPTASASIGAMTIAMERDGNAHGGGVYVRSGGEMTLSGAPKVTENAADSVKDNVFLSEGDAIKIDGEVGEAAVIGVTTEAKPEIADLVAITNGLKDNGKIAVFRSDDVAYGVGWNKAKTEAMLGMSVTQEARGYEGTYDGKDYTISVEVAVPASNYTVMYGEAEGTYDRTKLPCKNAGTHTVYYQVTAKGYFPAYGSADVVINPAPIAIIAEDKSKTEDEVDPALTYTVTGLVMGDQLSGSLSREPGEVPGIYRITQGSLAPSSDYTATFTGAMLTINAKPVLTLNGDVTELASTKPVGNTALAYGWSKVDGANGYDIFFKKCDGKSRYKVIQTITDPNVLNWEISGLKKGIAYKSYIRAWRMENGVKTYIGEPTPFIHAIAGGFNKAKRICNAKSVTVKKPNVTLKVRRKATIKAKVEGVKKGYKVLKHVARLRYYSGDKTVAKVNKKGRITAVAPGTCTIIVMANNGVYATVTVTVTN